MKQSTTTFSFFAIAGFLTMAVPSLGHAREATRISGTTTNSSKEVPEDNPDESMTREKFLAQAETRLENLDRDIRENDFHQRRIERLQERHRELTEEEDDKTYLRSVGKFARDLRQLEKEVYGKVGSGS